MTRTVKVRISNHPVITVEVVTSRVGRHLAKYGRRRHFKAPSSGARLRYLIQGLCCARVIRRRIRASNWCPNSDIRRGREPGRWRTPPVFAKPGSGSARKLGLDDPKPDVICAEIAFLKLACGSAVAGAVICRAEE